MDGICLLYFLPRGNLTYSAGLLGFVEGIQKHVNLFDSYLGQAGRKWTNAAVDHIDRRFLKRPDPRSFQPNIVSKN